MSLRERYSDFQGTKLRRDFRESLFSIFIDNLNPIVNTATLWGVFKVFGKVRDVFLSLKNSSREGCYAFIRFESLDEAAKVASKTNGMHVFGWPIVSKVADFGWKSRRTSRNGQHSQKSEFSSGKASFVEVLRGDLTKNSTGHVEKKKECLTMEWKQQKNDQDWLKNCAVGILRKFAGVSSVNRRLNNREYLEKLSFLEFFNLSYNEFEEEVPTKGSFMNTTKFSLTGNKRLCGGIPELHLPLCHSIGSKKSEIPLLRVVIPVIAAVLILSSVAFHCRCLPKKEIRQ